jgi:hypothetical protein
VTNIPSARISATALILGSTEVAMPRLRILKLDTGPADDNDFVSEFAFALHKRAKAIKHRGVKIESQRVKEIKNGVESPIARLDVKLTYRIEQRVTLTVAVWPDRWIWVDARRSSKRGWLWASTLEGRFLARAGAPDLVRHIEATLDASHGPHDHVPHKIAAVWAGSLAHGPRELA